MNDMIEGGSVMQEIANIVAEAPHQDTPPLADCVRKAVNRYFEELDGHDASDVYELVLSEIEPPLLEVVLREVRGNLSRAAIVLGLNRATLRKKVKKYGLDRKASRS